MSFNSDLTKKDIEFLDMLRETARYPEDYLYYNQMVDVLIGDLATPDDWKAYFKRIEEIYGYSDDK